MTRLTEKKIERWQRDLERALMLVRKVDLEVFEVHVNAKGSQWSHSLEVNRQTKIAARVLGSLVERDPAFSPLESLRRSERQRREAARRT